MATTSSRSVPDPVGDPEFCLLRIQAEDRPDRLPLGLDVGRDVLSGKGHDDPFPLALLVHLDAKSHRPRFLDSPQRSNQPREVGVRESGPAAGPSVRHPVHALHHQGEQKVRAIARLEQLHQPDRRNGRHQGADEVRSGQRHIGDGGPVDVRPSGGEAEEVGEVVDGPAGQDGPAGRQRSLQLVAGDDLADIHEHRRVGIAQLDDVQQHLLLPGIGHRRGEVQSVAVEGHRAIARAASEESGRPRQTADARGEGPRPSPENVHHARPMSSPHLPTSRR